MLPCQGNYGAETKWPRAVTGYSNLTSLPSPETLIQPPLSHPIWRDWAEVRQGCCSFAFMAFGFVSAS